MSGDKPLQPLIDLTILPIWQLVSSVREQVHTALEGHAKELRVASVMSASELVENAIKYGDDTAGQATIRFSLGVELGLLCIQVVNHSSDRASIDQLLARIAEIKRAVDKEGLYLQRVAQVLGRPGEGGNFGLYRIALEGGFTLDCSIEDRVVTVSATRKIR